MRRREALAALASLVLAAPALAVPALAASKLRAVVPPGARGPRGTTLRFALDHAPFAAAGYRDPTVLAYVPAHLRPGEVDLVVHFHGHNTTAERAIAAHQLREQLDDSGRGAVLVVPQLARLAADSSAGALEDPDGLARMLAELADELRRAGRGVRGLGAVCVSAHSGGFNAAAHALRHGGVDVRECWLFDALYDQRDAFGDWLLADARRKLVSFYAGETVTRNNLALDAALRAAGVDCRHEHKPAELTRADLIAGRAVFIAVADAHEAVPFAENAFRDCLCASCLPECAPTHWFDDLTSPRRIDRRSA